MIRFQTQLQERNHTFGQANYDTQIAIAQAFRDMKPSIQQQVQLLL